ncbi:hypothetical protein SCHPADRAFT_838975 [Schizopora paradoxa]|uniref:DDE Tnp4 domain-containing protein n=1 Tax=Schizopora paradoxa TaxID=27342 RepID=A0A0H2R1V7_9AGAM|nr:hypothetical protein SCHPADRAFT_838975 [Schizopora paradoxa]
MGRFGNAASLEDIAREAGCSEGAVELYTSRCFQAIEALHDVFVRPLTDEEKEAEKQWMDEHMGFVGEWRDGFVMYDGTIVVLFSRPGKDGDAYFTRKSNYGLNVQIGNTPSNLRIIDYSHGFTGSIHDAAAFEHTAAAKYPDWFFKDNEFAWCDSAYTLNGRTITVHRKPASLIRENRIFDAAVSHVRVRSEHCMGALKGRFQCLRGLRVTINSQQEHKNACRWITIAIILHNLVIDVEGAAAGAHFVGDHGHVQENEDRAIPDGQGVEQNNEDAGRQKRQRLINELMAYREGI